MSYTEKIREYFAEELPKPKERRELMLLGILINADISEDAVEAVYSSPFSAVCLKDLIRLTRNVTAEISEKSIGARKEYKVTVRNAKFAAFVSEKKQSGSDTVTHIEDYLYYVRGVFLASGRVSGPDAEESYLEFTFNRREDAENFKESLSGFDLPVAGLSKRRDRFVAYFKSRDKLADVLTAMDAGVFVFEYLNSLIFKSLEWNERRAINFISGNIQRTVIAGEKQTAASRFMLDCKEGALLTPELYTTAVIRVNNPTLSLSELAAMHTPPLTKSGLNHRLSKILELAKKYGFTEK